MMNTTTVSPRGARQLPQRHLIWGPAAATARTPAERAGLIHLLVVDDDVAAIEYLDQLLKGFAQISFATNGEDALRLAEAHRPDLVLLDVELPGMDGFEVCRRLRAMRGLGELPIIFATSHADPGIETRALALGGDDFVRKPFSAPVLCARVRRLVDRKRSLERHPGQGDRHRQISDGRVAAIVEACKDAILVVDAAGGVVMANAAACALLNVKAQPLSVRLDELLIVDALGRHCVQRASGQRVPVEASTSTEGHGTDALTVHVLRDTRERDREQALMRRQTEAAAARRATASMLSYIAHEIGNPVNVIKGFAQLMQAERMSASQADKLAHILDAVGHLSELLADVSDVARMESGQFRVELQDVELHALAAQACEPAAAQAAAAGMLLRAPPPASPMRARADARRLRQCLDNLLSNAIKYAGDGVCIEVEIEARGQEIVLAVQDHGCGLDEDQLAHLYEPYNRLGRDGGAIPGTGLGLTLTRDLVQAMGGRLEVRSQPGRGCRFEILLAASQPTGTLD
ncbi:hybrid sensor histidine kinase/response regulator [Pelomonas sp. Root1217]|uniref:hybrid sensor histidine kinase/response regulator n=1 Tax=Pelomonas sp. Root1217 TaxID=1736430 RepID=UPI000ADD0A31|nr:hybrid sensor histidine kinase/response regulator [Pelomonas sp. Root1217]